jgi:hypothetical protein
MCATSRNRIGSGRRSSALPKVGEFHATPKRPNPPKMHFYSGDHGGGARSPHDIALVEDTSLPAPPAEWSMFGAPCAINHIAIRGSVIPAGALAARHGARTLRARNPNGCHVCELEIDPATCHVALQSDVVVDDVGTVINPLTLAGQIHGGLVQGIGQILMEKVVYEPGSGQLLTASFMDYCMPRADDMCGIRIVNNLVPTQSNRWAPRARARPARSALCQQYMIAAMNALEPLGVCELAMPATSDRIWRAIHDARASS